MMCEIRTCFRLGKTLRCGDAESFLRVYDSLLSESSVSERQLESLKELARQISELSHEDFTLLQSACQGQLPTSPQFELGGESSDQLGDLLENLRQEVYFSDSGTVSDFDNSVCEDTWSRSNSFPEEREENNVPCIEQNSNHGDSERRPVSSTGEVPGLLGGEEEAHCVKPSRGGTESRHVTAQFKNSKSQQELSAAKSRQSQDSLTSTAFQSCQSKQGTAMGCSDRRGEGMSYMKGRKSYSGDQRRSWKGRNKPHGKRQRQWYPQEQWGAAATYNSQDYCMLVSNASTARLWDKQGRGVDAKLMRCSWSQGQTHKRSREGPRSQTQNLSKSSQTEASSSHLELAQFLYQGWVEVQKELQAAGSNC